MGKGTVAKADSLSSNPGTHILERENPLPGVVPRQRYRDLQTQGWGGGIKCNISINIFKGIEKVETLHSSMMFKWSRA